MEIVYRSEVNLFPSYFAIKSRSLYLNSLYKCSLSIICKYLQNTLQNDYFFFLKNRNFCITALYPGAEMSNHWK